MKTEYLKITEFCDKAQVEITFVSALQEEGILSYHTMEEEDFIEISFLPELEMFCRWHYDLGVNVEGIDAMRHMRSKMSEMQEELNLLRSKLSFLDE